MKPWLLFGAAGTGCGALILQQALRQQRPLVALVRKADAAQRLQAQGVTVVQGDACDSVAVQQAMQQALKLASQAVQPFSPAHQPSSLQPFSASQQPLIISTMGGGQEYQSHRTVIDCAEQNGLRQMILLTSLGCGDGWADLSPRAKAAFGQSVRQKTLAEVWLQTSQLDYCIVRPGGLLNGAATGKAQLLQQAAVHGFVNRADVAQTLCQLAEAEQLNQQIYSLIQADLQR